MGAFVPVIPTELLGTIPGWITSAGVITILGIVLRYRLGWKKLSIEEQATANADRADARDHISEEMVSLRENIASLRKELRSCEAECADKIKALQEELWGEKRQRVAEQISFINTILKSVDAPALHTLLEALERSQLHLLRNQK